MDSSLRSALRWKLNIPMSAALKKIVASVFGDLYSVTGYHLEDDGTLVTNGDEPERLGDSLAIVDEIHTLMKRQRFTNEEHYAFCNRFHELIDNLIVDDGNDAQDVDITVIAVEVDNDGNIKSISDPVRGYPGVNGFPGNRASLN